MKKVIIIAIFLINILGFAQVKGNENIISKTFDIENIESVKINLYAKVIIDCNAKNKMIVTADENLINKIDRKIENKTLYLNQLEWIQASQKIEITIGAPYLKEIESGTHDITIIKNFNNDNLKVIAPIGNIKITGATKNLFINAENGTVNAAELITENAQVKITGDSQTTVNVINELNQTLNNNARLKLINTPKLVIGDAVTKDYTVNNDLKWIDLKIKNNSWNRHKLVVVGPKKDGSQFSYGFAMMPGTVKKERWSIGSKIYKSTSLGTKKLLATVTKENENQIIKLFKD